MSGEHEHPELVHDHPYATLADLTAALGDLPARVTGLIALGEAITADLTALRERVAALEPEPVPVFTPDFYIAGDGDDANDGLTRATAKRSITTAPKDAVVGLYGGGIITGGALYDGLYLLEAAPGERVRIQGPGRYSLRLQRTHGSALDGDISILPPLTIVEPPAADGSDAGATRQAALEVTDCNDVSVPDSVFVAAGTDFGVSVLNGLRNHIAACVTDAAHGFHLKGNLGTGLDRSWFGGRAHDIHRLVRNDRTAGNDYGAVGFVFENSTGGGLTQGWVAERCFGPSFDYVADGGGLEFYDVTDCVVEPGTIIDCEGGFETGGSSGKGCNRNTVTLTLRGDLGAGTSSLDQPARSPGFLLRSFANSTLTVDADITRARCIGELYTGGNFSGAIDNSTVTVRYRDHGVPLRGNWSPPASTVTRWEQVA